MKYRKKPVVIEAIQWNGNNLKEVMEFIGSEFRYTEKTNYVTGKFTYHHFNNYLAINTLEGSMVVSTNDYIIKGIQGEFYPCKPDIFVNTYDEVDE